jgi:hypothetical protein
VGQFSESWHQPVDKDRVALAARPRAQVSVKYFEFDVVTSEALGESETAKGWRSAEMDELERD